MDRRAIQIVYYDLCHLPLLIVILVFVLVQVTLNLLLKKDNEEFKNV